jgi:conjugative transfer signal peptidase TraF
LLSSSTGSFSLTVNSTASNGATRYAAVAVAIFSGLAFVCLAAGLRFNTIRSIPVGIYRLTDMPVGKGEYVIFCPPPSALFDEARERGYIPAGFCPGGYGYMMKRVLGTKGDLVSSSDKGIAVNGELLPASALKDADGAGRIMPRYPYSDYTLKASELLLMSDGSPTSFDGRYFGPVNLSQVKGVITPIITF